MVTDKRKPELLQLIGRLTEEHVHPVKSDRAAADDRAGRNRTPENVRAGKFPDCQQGGEYRDQNAETRNPERNASNERRIKVAAS